MNDDLFYEKIPISRKPQEDLNNVICFFKGGGKQVCSYNHSRDEWMHNYDEITHYFVPVSDKLLSNQEAGAIAVRISERITPPLSTMEQAFFIAGFQECNKYFPDRVMAAMKRKEMLVYDNTIEASFDRDFPQNPESDFVGSMYDVYKAGFLAHRLSDAGDFAEWCSKNGWTYIAKGKWIREWTKTETGKPDEYSTTEQLYAEFARLLPLSLGCNRNLRELVLWLNSECPRGSTTNDLSHDFADNLRIKLNELFNP